MIGSDLLYTAHVPPGPGPFPTVIALHGWGAGAHDLLGLAPMLHGGRALMLCPQGSVTVPIGGGAKGYGWFPLVPGQPPDPAGYLNAAEQLQSWIGQVLERYPADPGKVVLTGFSQGGVMGYGLALSRPERFAGLAALSAWLPAPVTELVPKRPEHEGFQVLIVHGTEDAMLDVERARESREALRPYGVTLTYREFEMGHEIRPEALRVVVRWLDERVFARVPSPG
ncbi:MAG: alpha/beta hydrolase-fold protein [Acidobacteriota bacterium]|nr:alpha/beta hydrolase-fold protein [Acidobacteriota bacterium]